MRNRFASSLSMVIRHLYVGPCRLSILFRAASINGAGPNVSVGSILLKKSFGGRGRNFLEPLMRSVRSDVRDLVAFQKNDHRPSRRRYGACQRRRCPKTSSCEIFGVAQFSTFSTPSVKLGSRRSQL